MHNVKIPSPARNTTTIPTPIRVSAFCGHFRGSPVVTLRLYIAKLRQSTWAALLQGHPRRPDLLAGDENRRPEHVRAGFERVDGARRFSSQNALGAIRHDVLLG